MGQKEHLHFKLLYLVTAFITITSCSTKKNNQQQEEVVSAFSFFVDTTIVPHDTVSSTDKKLVLNNGIYYYNNLLYSGYIKVVYPDGNFNSIGGILNGMLHGKSISFYLGGKTKDIRMYRENKSVGKQIGYWENGNQKFEFYYLDDKEKEVANNGKPYINYEAKDGFRYGLQKSNLCYTLEKEKFKAKNE